MKEIWRLDQLTLGSESRGRLVLYREHSPSEYENVSMELRLTLDPRGQFKDYRILTAEIQTDQDFFRKETESAFILYGKVRKFPFPQARKILEPHWQKHLHLKTWANLFDLDLATPKSV